MKTVANLTINHNKTEVINRDDFTHKIDVVTTTIEDGVVFEQSYDETVNGMKEAMAEFKNQADFIFSIS
jgi:hypothetical protein